MTSNKRIIFFTCLTLFFSNNSFGQLAACANVDLGQDTTLNCNSSCVTLKANVTEVGLTDSYSVTAIPFAPPYFFNQGTPIMVGLDDVFSEAIDLPFNFCFFDNIYDKIVVGANGLLTFDLTLASPPGFNWFNATTCDWQFNQSIPNTSSLPYKNSINGAYHDINPSISGNIRYGILGTYPCRTFVVNFETIPHFSCSSMTTTQQIVLYETTNIIEVYIKDKPTCSSWNNGNAVIGIQNETGSLGYTPPNRNTGSWTTSNEAWRFTPNGTSNYSIEWFDNTGTLIGNTDSITVCPTTNSYYTANVTYEICDGSQVVENDAINVIINNGSSSNTSSQTACDSFTWAVNNQTYSTSGTYTDVYTNNITGCTHTEILNLVIDNNISNTATLSACESYFWPVNGQTYTSSGTYTDVTTNLNGCTNTEILNLTINSKNVSTLIETKCDSFFWPVNGQTYTNSATSVMLFTNPFTGCVDSNILDLTINYSTSNNTILNECDLYTWPVNGQTYTTSGIYTNISVNSNGCIHTETLDLSINSSTSNTTSLSKCDSYTWSLSGENYVSSGTYEHFSTNLSGCLHTETLNLTIKNSSINKITEFVCEPYTWVINGQNYDSSGIYTDTIQNLSGCDSILTLDLNIVSPKASFSYSQPDLCKPQIFFQNMSTDYVNAKWYFGDGQHNTNDNPIYEYNEGDEYIVKLIVESEASCLDSTSFIISAIDYNLFLPNSFTPKTKDNLNDIFKPALDFLNEYEFWIYDRFGELIFYSNDLNFGWDGTYKNKMCQLGVYAWKIKYSCGGKLKIDNGIVSLVK